MRRALDAIYGAAMALAAAGMVAIAGLVLYQVAGRILDRALTAAGGKAIGLSVPSLAEIGAFLFVASAFLALPATLRSGGHVRVTLLSRALSSGARRAQAVAVLLGGAALGAFATWHAGLHALDSWQFNSVSYGMVRIPLWWPQAAMTAGLGIFTLAMLDDLAAVLRGDETSFDAAEASKSIEEGEGR